MPKRINFVKTLNRYILKIPTFTFSIRLKIFKRAIKFVTKAINI